MNDVIGLHDDPDDPDTERRLRVALQHEADRVTPGDRFDDIRRQASRPRLAPVLLGAGAAAAVVVTAIVVVPSLIAGTPPADTAAPAGAPSSSSAAEVPTAPPSVLTSRGPGTPASTPSIRTAESSPGAPAPGIDGIPVYWIGPGDRLYREFRTVPTGPDRVTAALSAMTTQTPLDPDYTSAWPLGVTFGVTADGDDLTVDVSGLGREDMAGVRTPIALQQLIWTATAAAGVDGEVTVTFDGSPVTVAGGAAPTTRDPAARSQVWIIDPYEGQPHTAGRVTVTGEATAFEGTLTWTVRRVDGPVVADGFTAGGANGEYGPYSFAVDLEPGRYLITVTAPDASGGESGTPPATDSKTIEVG